MDTVIGIDLGTSTTEAAVIRDGKPIMIVNMENEIITPSAIGIDGNGNWVVGEKARAQYLLAPQNTVIEVKRKIGTDEKVTLGKQTYTPVGLSAKLLEYVKIYASEYLEEEVMRAVISVPAYFDEIQRQATVRAGMEAGLQVERILNEPTAAALSYGLEHMEEESHILVYDFGGGTFDVTLLEMFDGVLEVKASNGDNRLGGKDFDEKLMEWLNGQFQKKHGVDLRKNTYAMVKLKEEAERCKKTLSTEPVCHVLVPSRAVNPDYAVAEGAAIQAGIIQGTIRQEDSIIMTDVTPYTLGIRAMDGMTDDRMSVIIPRNVTIPTTRSQIYYTSWDYQTEAHIQVYQGESDIASSNHFLGNFVVQDIPSRVVGKERIEVRFSYNMNGMLDVKATILSTGADASIKINMLESVEAEERIDVSKWKEAPDAKQYRTIIRRVEKVLKDPELQYEPFLEAELEENLYELKKALIEEEPEAAREAEEELLELLDEFEEI